MKGVFILMIGIIIFVLGLVLLVHAWSHTPEVSFVTPNSLVVVGATITLFGAYRDDREHY